MKPYGVRMSFRPGCACCNTRDLHNFKPKSANARSALTVKNGKRAPKKQERKRAKQEAYNASQE